MNEYISISYTSLTNAADVAGFVDTLSELLIEQGSSPLIQTEKVSVDSLKGNQFEIKWSADYDFATPDQYYRFKATLPLVEVVAQELDYNAMMLFVAGRAKQLNRGYRDVLRGIFNVSVNLKNGTYVPTIPAADYLSATLEAAVNAFPNSN